MTPAALGKRYGVSDVTVRKYLTKNGVRLRDRRESAINHRDTTKETA